MSDERILATFRDELLAHQGWMRRLARGLVSREDEADDVVQETWLAAWRHRRRGRGFNAAWLGRVVRNRAAEGHRREEVRRRSGWETPEPAPSAEEIVTRLDEHRMVVDAVLGLEEPYRSTVLLRYFHDLTPARIADVEGVPAATVRSRLKRGLERVRARLDAAHGGDGRAWCAALLRFVDGRSPAAATAVVGGAWIMSAASKAIVAAVVVLAATAVWIVERDGAGRGVGAGMTSDEGSSFEVARGPDEDRNDGGAAMLTAGRARACRLVALSGDITTQFWN